MADRRSSGDSYDEEVTDGVSEGSDGGSAEVEESDGDLVVRGVERALDMQVVGGCRSDERLKPLLKFNASNGVAEDRLLAHLSQHFEAVEVGLLARCLCIPLVSIRVGNVMREGSLLCPTSSRGNLNLTVLPTSDLRLSFTGDDGRTERLFTLSTESPSNGVAVDEISADSSGRSFLIKIPDGETFYFWCSEKSKLLGFELLAKMRDFLVRRPSIAELTGISELRLGCFATHLRAYLTGSTSEQWDTPQDGQSSKPQSLRSRGNLAARANPSFQGSLSPRSSSFKEGASRNLCGIKIAAHLVVENLSAAEGSSSSRCCSQSEESSSASVAAALSRAEAPPLLPPLSSLLPAAVDLPALDFPPFLAGPAWVDPIVHIPVIGVCSTGPGYLVSAGPTDSLVEKSARETLRLLMGGAGQAEGDEAPSVMVGGLYGGSRDVDVIATIGLVEALVLGRSGGDEEEPRPPEEDRSQGRRLDSD